MFADQNSRPLEKENRINITLVINSSLKNVKMIRYSVQLTDQKFVKGHRFLSFTNILGKNIGRSISKNVSSKCSQKLLDHAEQLATDFLKPLQKEQFKNTRSNLISIKLLIKLQKSQKPYNGDI